MDMQALKRDLGDCLRQMPPELMKLWIDIGRNHMAEMATLIPIIADKMKPHLYAGMTEMAMGVIDREMLEKVAAEVFADFDTGR